MIIPSNKKVRNGELSSFQQEAKEIPYGRTVNTYNGGHESEPKDPIREDKMTNIIY